MVRKKDECAAIRSYNNKKSTIGKFDRWKVPPSSFCYNHAVWCDSGLSFSNVHYLFQFVYLMHALVKIIYPCVNGELLLVTNNLRTFSIL